MRDSEVNINRQYDVLCIGLINMNMPVRPVDKGVFDRDVTMVDAIDIMPGGDAMNEAITLSRLGNRVGLVGKIGEDIFGQMLLEMTSRAGVDTKYICKDKNASTSVCVMLVNQDGSRNFASHRGANCEFSLEDIDLSILKQTKIVNIGSIYALKKLDGEGVETILLEARKNGVITCADMMCDTYGKGFDTIKGALGKLDYFIPSYDEAAAVTGETRVEKIAEKLLDIGIKNVIIKLGAKGCFVSNDKQSFYEAPYEAEVVDTTGAGDNFVAGFLTGLNMNWELSRCIELANAVGSLAVGKVGSNGAVHSMDQVMEFMKNTRKININRSI